MNGSPPVRIVHVFQSRAKLWTRCHRRVQGYAEIVTRIVASRAEPWRSQENVAICIGCAHRRT